MAKQTKPQPQGKLVVAKVAHIQPGTLIFREEGAQFPHDGDLYEHVEVADPGSSAKSDEDDE